MTKLKIFFKHFALRLFHARFKKTWNQTVINYHPVTSFEMLYIYIQDRKNYIYMLNHGNAKKSVMLLMSTVAISNLGINVWTWNVSCHKVTDFVP